jgi:hypothetical protein
MILESVGVGEDSSEDDLMGRGVGGEGGFGMIGCFLGFCQIENLGSFFQI